MSEGQTAAAGATATVSEGTRSYDIFVSYRTDPDKKLADALKQLLESTIDPPPRVFVAASGGLRPSHIGYYPQITAALRSARAFVGIFTEASRDREWLFYEAGAAHGREALYAPLVVKIPISDLPSTISVFQATDASVREGVHELVRALAERVHGTTRSSFVNSYRPFQRVVDAYPDDPEQSDPSLTRLQDLVEEERFEEARGMATVLEERAESPIEKAKIRVFWILANPELDVEDRRDQLVAIPGDWREGSAWFRLGLASVERSEYRRRRLLESSLSCEDAHEVRSDVTVLLGTMDGERGDVEAMKRRLIPLLRSPLATRRAAAADVLRRFVRLDDLDALLLGLVTLDDEPDESVYLPLFEIDELGEWPALFLVLAERFEDEVKSGSSANQLGIARESLGLPNLAFEAYERAASRDVSVAIANLASLSFHNELARPGLTLLERHTGEFDAAVPSHPFQVRVELEQTMHREHTRRTKLVEQGRLQERLLKEVVDRALCEDPLALEGPFGSVPIPGVRRKLSMSEDRTFLLSSPKSEPIRLAPHPVMDGLYCGLSAGTAWILWTGDAGTLLAVPLEKPSRSCKTEEIRFDEPTAR